MPGLQRSTVCSHLPHTTHTHTRSPPPGRRESPQPTHHLANTHPPGLVFLPASLLTIMLTDGNKMFCGSWLAPRIVNKRLANHHRHTHASDFMRKQLNINFPSSSGSCESSWGLANENMNSLASQPVQTAYFVELVLLACTHGLQFSFCLLACFFSWRLPKTGLPQLEGHYQLS